jgi:hypothetical protein
MDATSAGDATRDERLQVQTLRRAGLSYSQIQEQLSLTPHQIAYAVNHPTTPKKRKGRPSMLSQEEIDHILRGPKYLLFSSSMSVSILSELLYATQVSPDALLAASPLFAKPIDNGDYNGLLSMQIGLLINRK